MLNEYKTAGDIAKAVVEELGGIAVVANICGIRPSSIYDWYRRGISQGFYRFLRLKFPNLNSWKLEKQLPSECVPFSDRKFHRREGGQR